MWILLILALTLICARGWIKWKVATLAIVYYIEKKQYRQPSEKDMKECTDFVVKMTVKDLIGR